MVRVFQFSFYRGTSNGMYYVLDRFSNSSLASLDSKKKKKKKKALGNRKVQNEHGYILFFFIVALGSASLTFSFVTLDLTTLIVVVSSFQHLVNDPRNLRVEDSDPYPYPSKYPYLTGTGLHGWGYTKTRRSTQPAVGVLILNRWVSCRQKDLANAPQMSIDMGATICEGLLLPQTMMAMSWR